jgi:hypothetical protein
MSRTAASIAFLQSVHADNLAHFERMTGIPMDQCDIAVLKRPLAGNGIADAMVRHGWNIHWERLGSGQPYEALRFWRPAQSKRSTS